MQPLHRLFPGIRNTHINKITMKTLLFFLNIFWEPQYNEGETVIAKTCELEKHLRSATMVIVILPRKKDTPKRHYRATTYAIPGLIDLKGVPMPFILHEKNLIRSFTIEDVKKYDKDVEVH